MENGNTTNTKRATVGATTFHFQYNAEAAQAGWMVLAIETPADCPVNVLTNPSIGQIATLREVCDELMDAYAAAQVAASTEGGLIQ